jgi:hypothetical protein
MSESTGRPESSPSEASAALVSQIVGHKLERAGTYDDAQGQHIVLELSFFEDRRWLVFSSQQVVRITTQPDGGGEAAWTVSKQLQVLSTPPHPAIEWFVRRAAG